MLRSRSLLAAALLLAAVGCGGGSESSGGAKTVKDKSGHSTASGAAVDKKAAEGFDAALKSFIDADAKGQWSDETCKEVAAAFKSASTRQESASNLKLAEAEYNAGLAFARCGKEADARSHFEKAVAADSKFHRAKTQLALLDYQKSQNVESAIGQLEEIIRDSQFQSVEALVALAALQMERGNDDANSDGKDDLERAKRNLQRALAIDDSYMPAFNQLAIYYLEQAKAKSAKAEKGARRGRRKGLVVSGASGANVNGQMLDLAALVASQAVRKNPKYAAIHNTSGLIQVELRNFNGAVKSFAAARQLDPDFFEAQMNYAALNLAFRGFEEAEKAYRDALRLKPKEYEAHLGLALAIRGQINFSNKAKLLPLAEKELAEAKALAGDRPETYYNEAILTQEFKAKGIDDEKKAIAAMEDAIRRYEDFVGKAGSDDAFAGAVKRSNDRIQDLRDTIKFLVEGAEARKADEEAQAAAKVAAAEQAKAEKAAAEEKAAADKAAAEEKKKADAEKAEADKKAEAEKADKSKADPKADKAAADKAGDKAATDKAGDKAAADKAGDKAKEPKKDAPKK
jgi:Flp pilus assembly protein TadD